MKIENFIILTSKLFANVYVILTYYFELQIHIKKKLYAYYMDYSCFLT